MVGCKGMGEEDKEEVEGGSEGGDRRRMGRTSGPHPPLPPVTPPSPPTSGARARRGPGGPALRVLRPDRRALGDADAQAAGDRAAASDWARLVICTPRSLPSPGRGRRRRRGGMGGGRREGPRRQRPPCASRGATVRPGLAGHSSPRLGSPSSSRQERAAAGPGGCSETVRSLRGWEVPRLLGIIRAATSVGLTARSELRNAPASGVMYPAGGYRSRPTRLGGTYHDVPSWGAQTVTYPTGAQIAPSPPTRGRSHNSVRNTSARLCRSRGPEEEEEE